MRNLLFVIFSGSLLCHSPAGASDNSPLYYEFALGFEKNKIDKVGLGSDPTRDDVDEDPVVDQIIEEDYEFEFSLEYTVNEQVYLFLTGSLIDETETQKFNNFIDTRRIREQVSGFERKEIGVGFYFGEQIASELKLGRMEFVSISEWWVWWDEELDAISLESSYGDFDLLLGVAREQARENTDADFIDPEINGIKHVIASLSWTFADDQSLNVYYLDQADNSSSFDVGEFEDFDRIDEEDADLRWTGVSYLGGFDLDRVGEIEIELHATRVSGDETLYEFDDPSDELSEVVDKEKRSVSGSAQGYLVSWTPASLDDWTFILGKARGSGDSKPGDNRNKSFIQNGLQGEAEVYGELYQPELSNMSINTLGVEWEIYDGIELALLSYRYRQEKPSDEIRDVSIDVDPDGLDRDLGKELDLVLTVETYDGLELILVAGEFEAGEAYGVLEGETSRYLSFELVYEF